MKQAMIIRKFCSPLCHLTTGRMVCYEDGAIKVLFNGEVEREYPITISKREKYLGVLKSLYRFFRMGIRAAAAIDENHIVYSIGDMLYEMDLGDGSVSKGYFCGEGIRPLIFTSVKGIDTFDDGLYFGGYLGNRSMKPVSIHKRVDVDKWETVYTFPQGTINHVHAIVSDPYRQCLWIFTGDFGEAAAIWRVTDNFRSVERILCNDQKYRGCVVYPIKEGLLYATDAPFAQNYLYLMKEDGRISELKRIDGSCIYGCRWKDKYVFSTTVEPDGRNATLLNILFSRKRGAGIKDDYVHMYCGNMEDGFKEIYKEKKDSLPYAAFQFGVFKFPYGVNNTDKLYFQPIATIDSDLFLLSLDA